jgi:predicted nucleic acid-binding protein
MPLRCIVANATPIISLSAVNHIFILQALFQRITIPKAVDEELKASEKPGADFGEHSWVDVITAKNHALVQVLEKDLDRGESEVIALGKELNADALIIDENIGYRIAKHLDLPVVRTLSLLSTAKSRGIITKVSPILKEMVKKGRWYSDDVVARFLKSVGE